MDSDPLDRKPGAGKEGGPTAAPAPIARAGTGRFIDHKRLERVDLLWARWWIGLLSTLLVTGWRVAKSWPLHRDELYAIGLTAAAALFLGASITRPLLGMASSRVGFLSVAIALAFGFAFAVGII